MTIEQQITIGNSANKPEANEPMRSLAAVTATTTRAAVRARSGMSNAVRKNFGGRPTVR